MGKGTLYNTEVQSFTDEATGARVRQLTSHPSIHHHPFYYLPAWDDAMQRLILVSHRTGSPQLFSMFCDSGSLLQLTDRDDLNEWSIHPSHDGRFVYFTAGAGAWRVDTETLKEEQLVSFSSDNIREKGMVGAAMGTTTLSRDDRWWAVPVKLGQVAKFYVIDTQSGRPRPYPFGKPLSTCERVPRSNCCRAFRCCQHRHDESAAVKTHLAYCIVESQPVTAAEVGEAFAVDELLHHRRSDQCVLLRELAIDPGPLRVHELLDAFDGRRLRCLDDELASRSTTSSSVVRSALVATVNERSST